MSVALFIFDLLLFSISRSETCTSIQYTHQHWNLISKEKQHAAFSHFKQRFVFESTKNSSPNSASLEHYVKGKQKHILAVS